MPQIFKIGSYWVFFRADESDPLESVHGYVCEGAPNATKIRITRAGKCYLCHNYSRIPEPTLRNIMKIIEARSEEVIQKWKSSFGEARYARYEPTEAVAQTESFCPCQKTGGNTAFLPVFFLHVLYGRGVHAGSASGFSHPFVPVRNRSHLLQHPKRTRFCPFLAFPGEFSHFSLSGTCKIIDLTFVHSDS